MGSDGGKLKPRGARPAPGRRTLAILIVAALFAPADVPDTWGQTKSVLEVLAVKIEPVRQGKNVVRVTVRNGSAAARNFLIGIHASSPDYGRGVGWGTQFADTIGPGDTKELRFAFWIHGPVTDKTRLTLSFYDPASVEGFDPKSFFLREQYLGRELARARPAADEPQPAAGEQAKEAISALTAFQAALRAKDYRRAWESVTADFQAVTFSRTETDFAKNIGAEDSPMKPYRWPMDQLLGLRPGSAARGEDGRLLLSGPRGQGLAVYLAREGDRWKVDEISGYTPQVVLWAGWEERILPKLESKRTKHFDIRYAPGSPAAKEIRRIAAERDRGFEAIAGFLGVPPGTRIRIVFFEDQKTKAWETGHRGAGWAYDRTIVEVFNESERLDPFHEVCHILADAIGDPPALFNEGLAVYMSERLGAPALKSLGGGTLTIDERVRQLKSKNEWIPIGRLLEFTEIGSDESQPPIAYAEAASFVKFLIEEFGREKFLDVFRLLKSPDSPAVLEANVKILRDIYGGSIAGHEQAWERKVLSLR
jgi:hypothetical protein